MREIKVWAVIWKNEVKRFYGVLQGEEIISVEPSPDTYGDRYSVGKGKNFYYIDSLAIFNKRKEAIAYRVNNKNWKVVPCKIKLLTPNNN